MVKPKGLTKATVWFAGIYGNVNRPCHWATLFDLGRFTPSYSPVLLRVKVHTGLLEDELPGKIGVDTIAALEATACITAGLINSPDDSPSAVSPS